MLRAESAPRERSPLAVLKSRSPLSARVTSAPARKVSKLAAQPASSESPRRDSKPELDGSPKPTRQRTDDTRVQLPHVHSRLDDVTIGPGAGETPCSSSKFVIMSKRVAFEPHGAAGSSSAAPRLPPPRPVTPPRVRAPQPSPRQKAAARAQQAAAPAAVPEAVEERWAAEGLVEELGTSKGEIMFWEDAKLVRTERVAPVPDPDASSDMRSPWDVESRASCSASPSVACTSNALRGDRKPASNEHDRVHPGVY